MNKRQLIKYNKDHKEQIKFEKWFKKMKSEGMTGFHVTPGPNAHNLSKEELYKELNMMCEENDKIRNNPEKYVDISDQDL